ncbi:hypothetical protein [Altericista sp. CCNU0014]|uniref:hypothetical protein n=1 Tax=Altericista sp. CCNU0014 TaxID=3082949 RepID=UPI00384F3071
MTCLTPSARSIGIGIIFVGLALAGLQPAATAQIPPSRNTPNNLAQSKTAPHLNTEIVPGVSVGPITAKTTYQDLVKIYGADKLSDVRPPDAEETEREFGTKVNLGPEFSFIVVWQDKTKTKPYETIEMGPGWKLPAGLRVGMTIAELQQKLGPFEIVGLGGPYSGIVPLTNTKLEQYFGKVIVQLAPKQGADKKFPQQYKAMTGEVLRPSTDPNWKPLEMKVKYIVLLFPKK